MYGSVCRNSDADIECVLHYVSNPGKTAQMFLSEHARDLLHLRIVLAIVRVVYLVRSCRLTVQRGQRRQQHVSVQGGLLRIFFHSYRSW